MKKLTESVRNALRKIAKETDNLFLESNITLAKQTQGKSIKLHKKDEVKYNSLIDQIPDGYWTTIAQLVGLIERNHKRNTIDSVTYSPLILGFKEFQCCKIMKYNTGHLITQRDREVEEVLTTLCKRDKRGVILIGEPGVGKTAIVNAVNARLIERTVPRQLIGCQILNMDIPYILSKYKEDPIGVIIKVLEKASEYDKVILFIDEVHQLLGHKLNDIMKPYLTEKMRFIGSTTINEYHEIITDDTALERRFTVVHVDEPSIETTIKMVQNTKAVFEDHHKCTISNEICEYAVKHGSRFLGQRRNPDKSLDILDIACTIMYEKEIKRVGITIEKTGNLLTDVEIPIKELKSLKDVSDTRILTEAHINLAISSVTGISYGEIKNSLDYKTVCEKVQAEVIGQTVQVKSISNVVNIFKHVKHTRKRPISTLLLVGSPGVGKKTVIQNLAKNLYGRDMAFIEYDMSGFTSEFMITELKGAPPGYVGYSKSGALIKAIKNNPQSIIYFKNIHKAAQPIIQYILDSCQKGSMVDSAEREAALNNAIIIYSITLGKDEEASVYNAKRKDMGFAKSVVEETDKTKLDAVKKIVGEDIFRMSDEVIIFDKLTKDQLESIFYKNLPEYLSTYDVDIDKEELKKRVLEDSNNGRDVINKLTSEIPKMVFGKLKGEIDEEIK